MKLLDKLDMQCPQGFTTAGATLFCKRSPTGREVRRFFRLFPIIACVSGPDGYWLRHDFADSGHDPKCGAYRAMRAVELTCGDALNLKSP